MDAVNGSRGFQSFAGHVGHALKLRICRWVLILLAVLSGPDRCGLAEDPVAQESRGSVEPKAPGLSISAREAQPGAAAKPDGAKPRPGKLVICGGGALPDELGRRFVELAGGNAARLVIITTASVLADTDRVESKLAFWRRQQLTDLAIVHTRSRETANQPEFAKPLKQATGVWFIGGNQNWLTETYLGTLVEQEIRGVLQRDGVVGGTSAGAAIMSPIMICRDKPELQEGPGFGFLPGTVVDQHFIKRNRQSRLLRVLDSHPDLVGLGIDEGTALVIEGPNMSVLGESQVMVCSPNLPDQPPQVRSLKAGVRVDLAQLRSEALARRPVTEEVADSPSSNPAKDDTGISAAAVSVGPDDRPATPRGEDSGDKVGQ